MPEPWGHGVTLFSLELFGRAVSRERALGGDTPTATPKPKDTDCPRPVPARGSQRAAPSRERPLTHMPQRRDSKGPLSNPCSVSLCRGPQTSMTGTEGPHRGVGGASEGHLSHPPASRQQGPKACRQPPKACRQPMGLPARSGGSTPHTQSLPAPGRMEGDGQGGSLAHPGDGGSHATDNSSKVSFCLRLRTVLAIWGGRHGPGQSQHRLQAARANAPHPGVSVGLRSDHEPPRQGPSSKRAHPVTPPPPRRLGGEHWDGPSPKTPALGSLADTRPPGPATRPDGGKEQAQLPKYLGHHLLRSPQSPSYGGRTPGETRGPSWQPTSLPTPPPDDPHVGIRSPSPAPTHLLLLQTPVEGPVWSALQNHLNSEGGLRQLLFVSDY